MSTYLKIRRFYDHFTNILFYISAALIFLCWVIITFEVFMRGFFNLPQTWVVEFTEYMTLFIAFFGAAWVMKAEGHIRIEIVVDALSRKSAAWLNFVTSIIGLIVCFIIFVFGISSVIRAYSQNLVTFTALELPKWPFLAAIPLGTLLLSLQFLSRVQRFWRERHASDS